MHTATATEATCNSKATLCSRSRSCASATELLQLSLLHVGEAELEQLQKTLKNVAKERDRHPPLCAAAEAATTTAKKTDAHHRCCCGPLSAAAAAAMLVDDPRH